MSQLQPTQPMDKETVILTLKEQLNKIDELMPKCLESVEKSTAAVAELTTKRNDIDAYIRLLESQTNS